MEVKKLTRIATSIILILIGGFLFIGNPIIFANNREVISYTAPCVDGDGDLNLEGIMCNKEKVSFFGIDEEDSNELIPVIVFLMGILGVLIFVSGVTSFVKVIRQ